MTRSLAIRTLLASIFLAAATSPVLAEAPPLTEKATGVAFAGSRAPLPGTKALDLTGVGNRTRLVFKVYALGFYADRDALKAKLAAFAGKSAEQLRGDDGFYAALAALEADRLAVLHFVRTVSAEQMRDAMADAMDRGVQASDPVRSAFLALWNKEIREGEEVLLVFSGDGRVTLVRGGAAVGAVTSRDLSRSLLQSWLGPKPVSEDIRAGIATRIPDLLR